MDCNFETTNSIINISKPMSTYEIMESCAGALLSKLEISNVGASTMRQLLDLSFEVIQERFPLWLPESKEHCSITLLCHTLLTRMHVYRGVWFVGIESPEGSICRCTLGCDDRWISTLGDINKLAFEYTDYMDSMLMGRCVTTSVLNGLLTVGAIFFDRKFSTDFPWYYTISHLLLCQYLTRRLKRLAGVLVISDLITNGNEDDLTLFEPEISCLGIFTTYKKSDFLRATENFKAVDNFAKQVELFAANQFARHKHGRYIYDVLFAQYFHMNKHSTTTYSEMFDPLNEDFFSFSVKVERCMRFIGMPLELKRKVGSEIIAGMQGEVVIEGDCHHSDMVEKLFQNPADETFDLIFAKKLNESAFLSDDVHQRMHRNLYPYNVAFSAGRYQVDWNDCEGLHDIFSYFINNIIVGYGNVSYDELRKLSFEAFTRRNTHLLSQGFYFILEILLNRAVMKKREVCRKDPITLEKLTEAMEAVNNDWEINMFSGSDVKRACSATMDMATKTTDTVTNFVTGRLDATTVKVGALTDMAGDFIEGTFKKTCENVDKFLEHSSLVTNNIRADLDSFKQSFESFLSGFSSQFGFCEVALQLGKLFSFFYLASDPSNQTFGKLMALTTLIVPVGLTHVGDFANSLTRAVQGVIGRFYPKLSDKKVSYSVVDGVRIIDNGPSDMVSNANDGEGCDANASIFTALYSLIKFNVCGMFRDVPPEQVKSMQLNASKISLLNTTLRGVKTLLEFFTKASKLIMEFVGNQILKFYGVLPCFMKDETLANMINEFVDAKINGTFDKCKVAVSEAMIVKSLRERAIRVEAKLNAAHADSNVFKRLSVLPYISYMVKVLDETWSRVPPQLQDNANKGRPRPFSLWLHGRPGVGKSSIVQPYILNEILKGCGLLTEFDDPDNVSFFRDLGAEYWEGYNGQLALQWNDGFQTVADEQYLNKAIREYTAINDDIVYPLNMAFGDKGRAYFTSKVVIMNAQSDIIGADWIKSKTWSQGQHIYRRRHVVAELVLNDKYLTKGGIGIDHDLRRSEMVRDGGIGDPKDPLFPKDMYAIRITDPLNGNELHYLSFEDGVSYIVTKAKEVIGGGESLKKRLVNSMKTGWNTPVADFDVKNTTKSNIKYNPQQNISVQPRRRHQNTTMQTHANEDDNVSTASSDFGYGNPFGTPDAADGDLQPTTQLCSCSDMYKGLAEQGMIDRHFLVHFRNFFDRVHPVCFQKASAMWIWIQDHLGMIGNHGRTVPRWDWNDWRREALGAVSRYVKWMEESLAKIPNWALYSAILAAVGLASFGLYKWYTNRQMEPNTSEGDVKAKNRRFIRQRRNGTDELVTNDYNQSNMDVENQILHHFFIISGEVVVNDKPVDVGMTGSGLCLGGDVFVMPRHYWHRYTQYRELYEKEKSEFYLVLQWSRRDKTKVYFDAIETLELDYNHCSDLVYMRIKNVGNMTNISKFFVRVTDDANLHGSYLFGPRTREQNNADLLFTVTTIPVSKVKVSSISYNSKQVVDRVHGNAVNGRTYEVPRAYVYWDSIATVGDCGMVLMHQDSKTDCRKCIGIHTAGSESTKRGAAAMIFYEDLQEVFNHFGRSDKIITAEVPEMPTSEIEESNLSKHLIANGFEIVGGAGMTTNPVSKKSRKVKVVLPRESKIQKSLVFDKMERDFGPHKTEPAVLGPYKEDDIVKYPFLDSVQKLSAYSQMVPQKEYDVVVDHICETINSWPSLYNDGDARVLTDYEMVNGYGPLKAIDMTTSPGFPYTQWGMTKRDLFTYHEVDGKGYYLMGDLLKKRVAEFEAKCLEGIVPEGYVFDSLKDETRPIKKKTKPRIFEVCPLEHLLLMRKYFGYWVCHMYTTYIEGECSVGINANSREWTEKVLFMLEVSNWFLNGDYKWYDSSLSFQICTSIIPVVNTFYRDQYGIIRNVLVRFAIHTFHIMGELIVLIRQGNPSGWFLTTLINVIANMFFLRWSYYKLVDNDLSKFLERVRAALYGDDNWAAVAEIIASMYNMITVSKILSTIGVTYTSASKEEIVKPLYTLDECSYLKRSFYFDTPTGLYLARLDYEVIMEIARWSEGDPTDMRNQMNRFNATLYELTNWGEEKFTYVRTFFADYVRSLQQEGYSVSQNQLFSYNWCKANMYPEYYPKPLGCPEEFSVDRSCLAEAYAMDWFTNGNEAKPIERVPVETEADDWICNMNETVQSGVFYWFIGVIMTMISMILIRIRRWAHSERDFLIRTANRMGIRTSTAGAVLELIKVVDDQQPQTYSRGVTRRAVYNKLDFRTNANEGLIDGLARGEEEVQEEISTFIDNDRELVSIDRSITNWNSHIPSVDMMTFLQRPFIIADFDWTATDKLFDEKAYVQLPAALRTNARLNRILFGIAFWRPTFEVTMRVNGTAMHYGRLIMGYIHTDEFTRADYYDAQTLMTGDNWSQISANGQRELTMRISFKSFIQWCKVFSGNYSDQNICAVLVKVGVPLASVNGVPARVGVQVFARIVDPTVAGVTSGGQLSDLPSVINPGTTPILTREGYDWQTNAGESTGGEAVRKTDSGKLVISKTLSDASTFASNLTNVPVIGGVASVVTKVTSLASTVAKWLGFSVPINLASTTPVRVRNTRFAQIDDLMDATVMGPSQDMGVVKDFDLVNGKMEDMEISNFISRPGLIAVNTITSTMVSGTLLWFMYNSPRNLILSSLGAVPVITKFYGCALQFMSRYFRFWRGSIRYHIAFTSSSFHSCRVRIMYTPYAPYTAAKDLIENSNNSANITVDIVGDTEVSFVVPYWSSSPWKVLSQKWNSLDGNEDEIAGSLHMILLNELTSGSTVVNPIYYQIFASAGPDFQFAGPTLIEISKIGIPFFQASKIDDDDFETNGDEAKAFAADSALGVKNAVYIPIMKGAVGFTDDTTFQPLVIRSIKQLCNMLCPVAVMRPYADTSIAMGGIFFANGITTFEKKSNGKNSTNYEGSYLMHMLSVFQWWRGSINVSIQARMERGIVSLHKTSVMCQSIFRNMTGTPAPIVYPETDVPNLFDDPVSYHAEAFFPDVEVAPCVLNIPYYNAYVCTPSYTAAVDTGLLQTPSNAVRFEVRASPGTILRVYMGLGDDGILGFPLGILPASASVAADQDNNNNEIPSISEILTGYNEGPHESEKSGTNDFAIEKDVVSKTPGLSSSTFGSEYLGRLLSKGRGV